MRLIAIIERHQTSDTGFLTVSALAKAAGISRSTIYKYYSDVIEIIGVNKTKASAVAQNGNLKKVDMMRRQLIKSKEITCYLTNVCTNQLIEISELKSAFEELERKASAKIAYLESKIAKLEKSPFRAV